VDRSAAKNAPDKGKQRVGWKVDGNLRSACTGFSFNGSAPQQPSSPFRHGFPTLSTRYRSLTRSRMTSLLFAVLANHQCGGLSALVVSASANRQRPKSATSLKCIRHSRPRERGTSGECRESMPERRRASAVQNTSTPAPPDDAAYLSAKEKGRPFDRPFLENQQLASVSGLNPSARSRSVARRFWRPASGARSCGPAP
jgi:hypothetical protein